jgi:hypothetical protein
VADPDTTRDGRRITRKPHSVTSHSQLEVDTEEVGTEPFLPRELESGLLVSRAKQDGQSLQSNTEIHVVETPMKDGIAGIETGFGDP